LDFVNSRGFIYFWPIKGIDFPSLWTAVAGDRPVPTSTTIPATSPGLEGQCARPTHLVLRQSAAPQSDHPLAGSCALLLRADRELRDYREDYLIPYQDGRLPQGAKQVYEAILDNGPLHTIDLRRLARMSNARDSEFNKALEILQADFKILPIGVAQAGSWNYAFIYEITARYWPDLPEQARHIGEAEARAKLLELYFQSVGAAQMREVNKVFQWGARSRKGRSGGWWKRETP